MSHEDGIRRIYADEGKLQMVKSVKKRVDERTKEERDIALVHDLIFQGKEIPEELKKYVPED
jgi:ASC-1-like (ASCH) protein